MSKKYLLIIMALGACAATPTTPTYQAGSSVEANAYNVVSAELSARLPGQDVRPYANCIMQNASAEEISKIAALGPGTAPDVIASVISRRQVSQCISRLASAGASGSASYANQQPSYQPVYTPQPRYSPPPMPVPVISIPAPQVAPITLPGSNTVRCISTGISTVCR